MNSLSELINKNISESVTLYIQKIAEKHKLNEQELCDLWNNLNLQEKKVTLSSTSTATTSSLPIEKKQEIQKAGANELSKLSVSELKELCKAKNLKVGGTKNELITRLNDYEIKKKEKTVTTSSSHPSSSKENTIVKKLIDKQPTLKVIRNSHGNYEHEETKLVLDSKTQKVYGKQLDNGKVIPLTKEDIETCNKYKFQYVIPENLDKKNVTNGDDDDVEIELEIEEDEEEEEEELDVEEDIDDEEGDEDDEEEEEYDYEE